MWIEAPGEAEAELASLVTADRLNIVLSEDSDCFVFGGPAIMRFDLNTSNDEEVVLYCADNTKAHPDLRLEHADFIFIALAAGGDYGQGIPNCGIDTAFQLAKTGLGRTLLEGVEHYQGHNLCAFLSSWCQSLILEAATNKSGLLPHKYPHLARSIPANFPTVMSLNLYAKPLPDPSMLASFAEHCFIWGDPVGILKHFSDAVFPGLATQSLMAAAQAHDLGFSAQSQTPISHVISLRGPSASAKCPRHQEVRLTLYLSSKYVNHIVTALEKWMKEERAKVKAWAPLEMVRVTWPALLSPLQLCISSVSSPLKFDMAILNYAGIHQVLSEQAWKHEQEDIKDDIEGEKETLPDLVPEDLIRTDAELETVSQWRTTVTGASKGVTDKTESEYHWLMKQCVEFLISHKLIQNSANFFCPNPPENAPLYIVAWIMNQKCEAMTYVFGRLFGLGSRPWQKSEVTGQMVGNPSVSETVAIYMTSLRTQKEILEDLYDFNHHPENWDLKAYVPGSHSERPSLHQWGGPLACRALGAIYTVAFLCLLRSNEVLKICCKHVEFHKDGMTLTLPFRKTHQDGGIEPFVLHALHEEEAHLCPVRALAEWIDASKITSGYIFRKIVMDDRPSAQDIPMTSEQFLEMFRNNLLDINVDPYPYGTHSFRCAGVAGASSFQT
ncbi:unnamed protein product [Cyclocybe aegerita]|uniref:XPG-I domain-containing protein n=1 Tax=Cyclocybe aegerita TaxID=1973307 RepID=A0A8S0W808_CYCAE|nr:unnamed protein product [Cyclocybe aegerita]